MPKGCLLIIALTLATASSRAAEYSARIWQSEVGLPGNVVRSIGQTADGHLWIATAEGGKFITGHELIVDGGFNSMSI